MTNKDLRQLLIEKDSIISRLMTNNANLEKRLTYERSQISKDIELNIVDTVRFLRGHETILVHLGDHNENSFRENFDDPKYGDCLRSIAACDVFYLNKSPLSDQVKTVIRETTKNGLSNW
ncbi:MAG: hypothetical protein Q8N30_03990 [Methylococcales bacterium]|nr:hypothetical protein [Methylococcales bacterium]